MPRLRIPQCQWDKTISQVLKALCCPVPRYPHLPYVLFCLLHGPWWPFLSLYLIWSLSLKCLHSLYLIKHFQILQMPLQFYSWSSIFSYDVYLKSNKILPDNLKVIYCLSPLLGYELLKLEYISVYYVTLNIYKSLMNISSLGQFNSIRKI